MRHIICIMALAACGGKDTDSRGLDSAQPPITGINLDTGDTTPTTTYQEKLDLAPYYTLTSDPVDPSTESTTTGALLGETDTSMGDTSSSETGEPQRGCGDGVAGMQEPCDGDDLHSQTCQTQGFVSGALSCAPNCTFDTSLCSMLNCGDGVKQPIEACDCGGNMMSCSGPQLGLVNCADLLSPYDTPYAGGVLSCTDECELDESLCKWCGDGSIDGNEVCDGLEFGGTTCQILGFEAGGVLKCTWDCQHDKTGCKNAICGNELCEPSEDSCNCWNDCADDPMSCSSCECGMAGGECNCTENCADFDDCCANVLLVCG